MSFRLKIDKGLGCAFIRWKGNVGREDILSYRRALEALPSFRRGLNRLHDYRSADFVLIGSEVHDVAETFKRDKDRHGEYKAVMLVASDLSSGMSRMYEAARDQPGVSMLVTRDLAEAKAWLGLPADRSDPFEDMAAE